MKIIYKKRLSSPIQQIIPYKSTFSYIIKTATQYIHPDQKIDLPFTPKQFTFNNNTFFYLHKNKVFYKSDSEFKKIKIPNKTHRISSSNSSLLLTEKKIIKMELINNKHEIVEQLYGPTMHISCLSTHNDKILAICYGDQNIYLFNKKDHLIFNGKSLMVACCLFDDENFAVCEGTNVYFYSVNKKGYSNFINVGHDICVIESGFNGLYIGCVDGFCFYVRENVIVDEFNVDGFVSDLKVIGNKVVVGSGYDKDIHNSSATKPKNYLTIFEKSTE